MRRILAMLVLVGCGGGDAFQSTEDAPAAAGHGGHLFLGKPGAFGVGGDASAGIGGSTTLAGGSTGTAGASGQVGAGASGASGSAGSGGGPAGSGGNGGAPAQGGESGTGGTSAGQSGAAGTAGAPDMPVCVAAGDYPLIGVTTAGFCGSGFAFGVSAKDSGPWLVTFHGKQMPTFDGWTFGSDGGGYQCYVMANAGCHEMIDCTFNLPGPSQDGFFGDKGTIQVHMDLTFGAEDVAGSIFFYWAVPGLDCSLTFDVTAHRD